MVDPSQQMELHERQQHASNELVDCLLPSIPSRWKKAELQLDVAYSELTGVYSVEQRLFNPETQEEVLDFPESLFRAATGLHMAFNDNEKVWKRCILKLCFDGSGAMIGSESNFEY